MTDHQYDTPHPLPLRVQIHSGAVEITAAEVARSIVQVTGPGADDVEVTLTDEGLDVIQPGRTGFLRSRQVNVRLSVPTGSQPAVRTASADITMHGTLGETEVRTGSGEVRLELLAEAAFVETGSGDITVTEAQAPLRLKSGSGDLQVGHTRGPLAVSTGSGDVLVATAEGPVAAKTGSGDLQVRRAESDITWQTGTGDLTVGRIERGTVQAKSGSGDVALGVPVGLPVWTDISTVTGDVSHELPSVGAPAAGEDHLEVRVTSATGDVRLHEAN